MKTVWKYSLPALLGACAAAQDPNSHDITSNTQWSILYDNTDLSADIAIRRHWNDMHHFTL